MEVPALARRHATPQGLWRRARPKEPCARRRWACAASHRHGRWAHLVWLALRRVQGSPATQRQPRQPRAGASPRARRAGLAPRQERDPVFPRARVARVSVCGTARVGVLRRGRGAAARRIPSAASRRRNGIGGLHRAPTSALPADACCPPIERPQPILTPWLLRGLSLSCNRKFGAGGSQPVEPSCSRSAQCHAPRLQMAPPRFSMRYRQGGGVRLAWRWWRAPLPHPSLDTADSLGV